jgi:cytoskeletal protein CcmA (bactofilin family)
MVFRRDKGGDAFQRQISALRQQLGSSEDEVDYESEEGGALGEERENYLMQDSSGARDQDQGYSSYGYGSYDAESRPDYGSELNVLEDPGLPAIPSIDAQTTVVSHDTSWKGEIESEGSIHIHGQFDGTIRAREDVYILEEATVDATVQATNIVIAGAFTGSLTCQGRFEVLPSGRVQGEIVAPTLVVHDGASINGNIRMIVGESAEPAPPSVLHRRAARGSA